MNQMVELLQYIARTAHKTQETVKTLAGYFDDSSAAHMDDLYMMLESVKINSIKSTVRITTESVRCQQKESLHRIKESMNSGDEIYGILKRSMPHSAPESLKHRLDANMQGLNRLWDQVTPFIAKFYEGEEPASPFLAAPL